MVTYLKLGKFNKAFLHLVRNFWHYLLIFQGGERQKVVVSGQELSKIIKNAKKLSLVTYLKIRFGRYISILPLMLIIAKCIYLESLFLTNSLANSIIICFKKGIFWPLGILLLVRLWKQCKMNMKLQEFFLIFTQND